MPREDYLRLAFSTTPQSKCIVRKVDVGADFTKLPSGDQESICDSDKWFPKLWIEAEHFQLGLVTHLTRHLTHFKHVRCQQKGT